MIFKASIAIALLCIFHTVLVQSSPAPCNCGLGTGTNVCRGRSCQAQVVRPQPLPLIDHPRPRVVCKTIGGVEPLKPIGDLCSCGQSIVKPAHIPKPACSGCGGLIGQLRNAQSNSGFGQQNGEVFLNQGERILGSENQNEAIYISGNGGSYLNENGGSYSNENSGSYLNENSGSYLNGNSGSSSDGNGGFYLNENGGSYVNENSGSYLNRNSGSYSSLNGGSYLGNGNGDDYQTDNVGEVIINQGYQGDNSEQITINSESYINQNSGSDQIDSVDIIGGVSGGSSFTSYPGSLGYSRPSGGSHVPADPVSQSIALQRSDVKTHVSDSKLQFGFHKLPQHVPRSLIKKTSFPEGNIQRLNGPILELKATPNKVTVDEEAIEDLLEDEPEIDAPAHVRKISLGELGYGLEKGSSTRFVNLDVEEREEKSCASEPHLYKCNDGFRGGQVVINEAPVPSEVYVSNKKSIPCSADEHQHHGHDNLSFLNEPSYTYSESSSSSNSNSARSNVFFQKLRI